jgi:cellulose biosynthesis protein BcsQ
MPGRIIAFSNRKGGVGKTTSAIAVADTLHTQFRHSVCVVDTDPQASASYALLGDPLIDEPAVREIYLERLLWDHRYRRARARGLEALRAFRRENVQALQFAHDRPMSLVPISPQFWIHEGRRGVGRMLTPRITPQQEGFRDMLRDLRQQFEFIIVDSAPGASLLFEIIVREADLIIVPCRPDAVSIWGLQVLRREMVHLADDPRLRVLWTMVNPSTNWTGLVARSRDGGRVPFPMLMTTSNPGAEDVFDGINQLVGMGRALDHEHRLARNWNDVYPEQVAPKLERLCREIRSLTRMEERAP